MNGLKHHRHCFEYRHQQPFALKLLDVPLLSEGDIAFCDTDVLFLRPFFDLFRWSDDATGTVFMADCREAYSVLPWHLVGPNKLQLPSRVNCGLFLLRKRAHDLDFLEWCLGRVEFRQIRIWIEQTCWAALGNRVRMSALGREPHHRHASRRDASRKSRSAFHISSSAFPGRGHPACARFTGSRGPAGGRDAPGN